MALDYVEFWQNGSYYYANDPDGRRIGYSGSSPSSVLNAAIADLSSAGGGVIEAGSGLYQYTGPVNMKSNVHLRCSGMGATIFRAASGFANAQGIIQTATADAVTNASVRHITLDGNYSAFAIELYGIRPDGAVNFKIDDVEIKDTRSNGIRALAPVGLLVQNCRLLRVGRTGSGQNGILCDTTGSSRIRIRNNHIEDWGSNGLGRGIYLSDCPNSAVTDNVLVNPGNVDHEHSICIENSPWCIINGNLVDHSPFTGTSQKHFGIRLVTASTDCVLSSNIIRQPLQDSGAFEPLAVATGCVRCVVSDNHVEGGDDNGLTIWANECTVIGNYVKDVANDGISLGDGASNCTVSGNVVKNAGQHTALANPSGISVGQGTGSPANNVITGNRCFDDQGGKTQAYGVRTLGTADYTLIVGNNLRGNLIGATSLVGANNVVDHNIV